MITKTTTIIGTLLAFSISSIVLASRLIADASLTTIWPGLFLVLLFFTAGLQNPKDLKKVFCGGVVGILWNYLATIIIGQIAPSFGLLPSIIGVLFVFVFLMAVLGDPLPTFFNNFSFVYYLIAAFFDVQKPVEWLSSLVVVGAVFAVFMFGGAKLFIKSPASPQRLEN